MRRIYIYLCLSIFLLPLKGQEVLNEYLQIAAENNSSLKTKFNEYMASLERVPQVGALPDPTVAFGYFIQPIETRLGPQQAKISATQMFPWFGTLAARENSAEAMAKARYEQFEEAKSKLFYDVKATYYNLFFTQKGINLTKENIQILTSFRNLTKVKVESGQASAVDAYRVEMEINDLNNQLALLQDNSAFLAVKFHHLLNVEAKINIRIADKLPSNNLSSKRNLLDSILLNNHALSSFDYQLDELQHRETTAGKEGLPQFSVGLEYAVIGSGNSAATNAGQDAFVFPKVGITVPLYRKKYKAKIKEITYLREAKTHEKNDKRNTLTTLFEEVWKDYQDAERRIRLYQSQTDLAQKSLTILQTEYATNNRNFEEILRMERKLLKYSLEEQKAVADKAVAMAFIVYLQGR